jgi:hypothetical protein
MDRWYKGYGEVSHRILRYSGRLLAFFIPTISLVTVNDF